MGIFVVFGKERHRLLAHKIFVVWMRRWCYISSTENNRCRCEAACKKTHRSHIAICIEFIPCVRRMEDTAAVGLKPAYRFWVLTRKDTITSRLPWLVYHYRRTLCKIQR